MPGVRPTKFNNGHFIDIYSRDIEGNAIESLLESQVYALGVLGAGQPHCLCGFSRRHPEIDGGIGDRRVIIDQMDQPAPGLFGKPGIDLGGKAAENGHIGDFLGVAKEVAAAREKPDVGREVRRDRLLGPRLGDQLPALEPANAVQAGLL